MRTDLLARLGEVSGERAVRPLWSLVVRVSNKNLGMVESNLLSLSYGRIIRKEIGEVGGLRPESFETYNVVEAGDSVLRMTDLQNDQRSIRTGLAEERGIITSAYVTIRPRPGVVDARYLAAALRAYDVKKIYYEMGAGVRQTLKFEELGHLPIPLPPLVEQRRVAEFLDRETAELDAMDAELNYLIETLHDRATVSVDHALSVVDRQVSLAWATLGIKTGPFGTQVKQSDYQTGGVPLVNPSHIRGGQVTPDKRVAVGAEKATELRRHAMTEGEIVVARRGELGRCAVIGSGEAGFLCGTGSLRVVPNPSLLNADFAALCISSRGSRTQMVAYSVGATMDNLNEELLGRVKIPLPPIAEQRRIFGALSETTAQIDEMIADANRLKALLAERRSTLISDVVTGKKEVPA